MYRRRRIVVIAMYLAMGGFIMQWGACWMMGANTLLPSVATSLIDNNGNLFGLLNVCGVPDQITETGAVLNGEDDLVTVCPLIQVVGTGGGV